MKNYWNFINCIRFHIISDGNCGPDISDKSAVYWIRLNLITITLNRTLSDGCGELKMLAAGEQFTFTNTSTSDQKCAWLFVAPKGSILELSFDSFQLPCSDRFEIRYNLPGQQGPTWVWQTCLRRSLSYARVTLTLKMLSIDDLKCADGMKLDYQSVKRTSETWG